MRNLILTAIFSLLAGVAAADTYFAYPSPPESLPIGRPRANYMVEHFWDHCPWKSAFSARAKMQAAFEDYAEFFPLAAADTVYMSIDRLMDGLKKKPKDQVALADMAFATFYADTAQFLSDDAFLPFAKAVAANKKVPATDRKRFADYVTIITNSTEGTRMPDAELILADGSRALLTDTVADVSEYVIIFDTPGSTNGRMQKVMFSANVAARQLVDAGVLKPLFIYPGTPPDDWWAQAAGPTDKWTIAAMPSAPDVLDLRVAPAIYMADHNMVMTKKFMDLNLLVAACEVIVNQYRMKQ